MRPFPSSSESTELPGPILFPVSLKTPKHLMLKQQAYKPAPLHACGTPQDKGNQG